MNQTKRSNALLIVQGILNNETPVKILFDDGAESNFISVDIAKRLGLNTGSNEMDIQYGNGVKATASRVPDCHIQIKEYSDKLELFAAKLNFDIILGMPWREKYNPQIDWIKKTIDFIADGKAHHLTIETQRNTKPGPPQNTLICNNILSAKQLERVAKKPNELIYICNLKASSFTDLSRKKDFVKTLEGEFPSVFTGIRGLPPKRPTDHVIDTTPGSEPPFKQLYPLAPKELETLKQELDRLLRLGLIRDSTSPYGAPIFFVKQKDKLRMVIDYRALNKITIKNRTALPNMDQVLTQLSESKYFSKLDLQSGFHQIRIKEGSEHKTAFRTKYGHYEFTVLPFGLSNSPATFQSTMNMIFKEFIDDFVIVYVDDILIYSKKKTDHVKHIRKVLGALEKHGFKVNLDKCSFMEESTEFLGHIIEYNSIKPDPTRVETIRSWQPPTTIHELRQFLGLTNTFLKFIPNYAETAVPLTELLRGSDKTDTLKTWNDDHQNAFDELKRKVSDITELSMPNQEKRMFLYTDWSKNAIGGWIGQEAEGSGTIRPLAFYSRKLKPAERNYSPYDGELLSLVENLRHFRSMILYQPITLRTDQKALKWLLEQNTLSGRQSRWLDLIQEYNLTIEWTKGTWNTVADALSRMKHTNEIFTQTINAITQVHGIDLQEIAEAQKNDPTLKEIITVLNETRDDDQEDVITRRHFSIRDDLLWFNTDRLCIPKSIQKTLFFEHHDTVTGGHRSWKAMYENLSRHYYWPTMSKDIQKYTQTCDTCQRYKTSNQLKYGKLVPLEIPDRKWQSIGMDFIVQLPKTKDGHDSIFVVVDRLTKMAHFIANKTTDTAVDVAKLYLNQIYRLHGLPENIVSDRDVKFTSIFWRELQKSLGTQLKMSTSRHPQTNGQTEKTNQTLEQLLRMFCNYKQNNWDQLLPLVEFTFNNTRSSSTNQSPFFLNYGYHPKTFSTLLIENRNQKSQETIEEMRTSIELVKEQLVKAQLDYSKGANKRRRTHSFIVGDLVLLSSDAITREIDKKRPSPKLLAKYHGPFKILGKVSPVSFKLELPPDMKIHDTFHVSLLKQYHSPNDAERITINRPVPELINDQLEYEVEEIMDKKKKRNKIFYLVHWKGYPHHDNTWEPVENLKNARDMIQRFESLSGGDM